ncbi:N-acetylmuramoyl-L-alanine amidase [Bacillus sp. CGMCC 1.16541]|uniref:N-acetylmuramoyl-L-alanine amidase n=1 Tax=Bacillus sp. CGMCC 1.16541 TaxID=2185143 RepID=UPI000D73E51F|nr:N-acetylmuramoyl-L-alanine amidase [Bacillus sp. CGMCC 1.16541]
MAKKSLLYGVCCSAMLSSLIINAMPSSAAVTQATVKVDTLNFRSVPSTNGAIIGKLHKNTQIEIKSEKDGWSNVLYEGKTGWVSSSYIKKQEVDQVKEKPTQSSVTSAVVNASMLNVRSTANTSGAIVTKLPKNTTVTVLSVKGNWSQVRTNSNQSGWVANQYLTAATNQPAKPVPSSPATPGSTINEEMKTVKASSLNVRSIPSTTGNILMSLSKNTDVYVLKVEGDWTRIKTSDNRIGWVASQYLGDQKQTSPTPTQPSESLKVAFVNASVLNVRSVPSINGQVLTSLSNQTEVKVVKTSGSWTQIQLKPNQVGWVASQYLTTSRPVTPTPNPSLPVSSEVLKGETIVLDAGHGGKDPGAVANGISEKDVTMDVIYHVEKKLRAAGATVIMTRSNDTYPTLGDRVDIANKNKADLFISVHVNAASPDAQGAETYYDSSRNPRSQEGKKLAEEIQRQLVSLVGMKDRKVKSAGFQVIKYTNMPSVLVELGFVTNKEDAKKLASQRELYAQAIVNGILAYYEKQ